MFGIWSTD